MKMLSRLFSYDFYEKRRQERERKKKKELHSKIQATKKNISSRKRVQ